MYNENLIVELKGEHRLLFDMLDAVKRLKITSSKGLAKLKEANDIFLKHLQREKNELYPVLIEKSQNNEELKKKLKEFNDELVVFESSFQKFYEKYYKTPTSTDFILDFHELLRFVKDRINREEMILYKFY